MADSGKVRYDKCHRIAEPVQIFFQYLATILYGLTRFLSQILGSFLLLRFRRRHLLVFSCFFVAAAMSGLATASYLTHRDRGEDAGAMVGWLPMLAVVTAALAYHLGLGPIPWAYTGELELYDHPTLCLSCT